MRNLTIRKKVNNKSIIRAGAVALSTLQDPSVTATSFQLFVN